MTPGNDAGPAASDSLLITRPFDAPRDKVFEAWTHSDMLARWWAPKGFTTPFCKVDLRAGGAFHYCMRSAQGVDIWGIGLYRDIVTPERIVYVDAFANAAGKPVPPSHYGMSADYPARTLVTVTLAENEGKTTLTLRQSIPQSSPERAAAEQGWNEMLDRLADLLEHTKPELRRLINAPG